MSESSGYRATSPGGLREALADTYRTYYDTAFDLRDPDLKSRRAVLMESGGGVSQEPLVELLAEYVPSMSTLAEVCDGVGLPELEPLLSSGLLAGIEHPYATSADQRVPVLPLGGTTCRLGVTADPAVTEVVCEWSDGTRFPLAPYAPDATDADTRL